MNKREAVQFIALNYSRSEVLAEGVEKYIPVKKQGTNINLASRDGNQEHLFDYVDIGDVPGDK